MPATVTGGKLDPAKNRVRTSNALQGNAMWQSVIGVSADAQHGNVAVEKLIRAPEVTRSHGKEKKSRQEAAAEAVKLTKSFDTGVTDYDSLLSLAKSQGCLGSEKRGACKICGQVGHLTKQCRNQFSKFFRGEEGKAGKAGKTENAGGYQLIGAEAEDDRGRGKNSGQAEDGYGSDASLSSLSSFDEEKDRKKEKKKRKRKKEKRRHKDGKEKHRRKE